MTSRIKSEDFDVILARELPWDKFLAKRILITGGAGFIPAYMVGVLMRLNERVLSQACHVTCLVRNIEKARQQLGAYESRDDFRFLESDVVSFAPADGDYDIIIHAASQASPKHYRTDPVGTMLPNIIGTRNLLEYAKGRKGSEVLFFSSAEVYGQSPRSESISEKDYGYLDLADVRSCYAESKRAGEMLGQSYYKQFGVSFKSARIFHTYGPGMSFDDGRVFADFVSDIVNERNITMTSDGSAVRAFSYLSDTVAGLFTILLNGLAGVSYNVGNPDGATSILGLAHLLCDMYPEKGLRVIRREALDSNYAASSVSVVVPSVDHLRSIGWTALVPLSEGFGRTIEHFKSVK